MFEDLTNSDLEQLLDIQNSESFCLHYKKFTKSTPIFFRPTLICDDSLRISSILNKSIFFASIPSDLLWMFVGLGFVVSIPILMALTALALFAGIILAWSSVSFAADSREAVELELTREHVCLQLKQQMQVELNSRVQKNLLQECRRWISTVEHNSPEVKNILQVIRANEYGYPLDANFKRQLRHILSPQKEIQVTETYSHKSQTDQSQSLNHAFITLSVMATLGVSFLWGGSDILAALGMVSIASAMVSPLGIALAAVVFIGIGVAIGYQRYRYNQKIAAVKTENDYINGVNCKLTKAYNEDKDLVHTLQLHNIENNSGNSPNYGSLFHKAPKQGNFHKNFLNSLRVEPTPTLHAPSLK